MNSLPARSTYTNTHTRTHVHTICVLRVCNHNCKAARAEFKTYPILTGLLLNTVRPPHSTPPQRLFGLISSLRCAHHFPFYAHALSLCACAACLFVCLCCVGVTVVVFALFSLCGALSYSFISVACRRRVLSFVFVIISKILRNR